RCVFAGQATVEPKAELVSKQRARGDMGQVAEVRSHQSWGRDSPLLAALPVTEEEQAVAADWTPHGETELPPLEEWIRVGRIALQGRVGGQFMIPEEIESGAMWFIGARARGYIDGAGEGHSGREVEIRRRDLELLHHVL